MIIRGNGHVLGTRLTHCISEINYGMTCMTIVTTDTDPSLSCSCEQKRGVNDVMAITPGPTLEATGANYICQLAEYGMEM